MSETQQTGGMNNREIARLVAAGIVAIALIAFAVDNTQSVRVGFVFFERNPPLIWALVLAAVLGAVLARLATWIRRR